ncbi:MAG: DUF2344 domain-containing protein [Phycisphaerae bacterium]|nr:DUF2344 domain-containing protein [Phycisphaerae bacterium]
MSHQETMTMWCRVLTRSGVDVCFSQGYNPHPKISLPLPRTVGVRSDDECLCAQVCAEEAFEADALAPCIQASLPEGCIVTDVGLYEGKVGFCPVAAVYEFPLESPVQQEVHSRVSALNASATQAQPIMVERRGKEGARPSTIDVRPYIASAIVAGDRVAVDCRISPAGTVRVDEIMQLLGLRTQDLKEGVLRRAVQWERN